MKKIDPNVASEMMEKELKKQYNFQEQANRITESFDRLEAFVEVLDGCLGYKDYSGGFDYDKIFPFTNELKDLLERTKKDFDDFNEKLWKAGRIRSHFEGEADKGNMVFVKSSTKVERIPTTYYREKKKEGKEKKAA
jgi:hypothetical protein